MVQPIISIPPKIEPRVETNKQIAPKRDKHINLNNINLQSSNKRILIKNSIFLTISQRTQITYRKCGNQ